MSESFLILVAITIAAYLLIVPAVALALAVKARRQSRASHARIAELEGLFATRPAHAASTSVAVIPAPSPNREIERSAETAPPETSTEEPVPHADGVVAADVVAPAPVVAPADDAIAPEHPVPSHVPPLPATATAKPGPPARDAFSLEHFLGVKLFAWLGGIALFAGLIFFVKYAFEHNLIPPALRVAIGYVAGASLLTGGLAIHRRREYRVLAQSLCATGLLTLYGVSFAAHALYRFPAFGPAFTFTLLGLVTMAAFLIAVRLDALVVAALGMFGGFLSPLLLPGIGDQPIALFGYLALLDAGLLALALRGRWTFLSSCAAAGTVLMQLRWWTTHFAAGGYAEGTRTWIPLDILAGFAAMFVAVAWARRKNEDDPHPTAAALGVLAAAMAFAFHLLSFDAVSSRCFLLHGFVLLLNLGAILAGCTQQRFRSAPAVAASLTLVHLAAWTTECLKPELLVDALASYLAFGTLHAMWPLAARRLRLESSSTMGGSTVMLAGWMAPAVIALTTLPILLLPELSWLVWPALLLANLLAIGVAATMGLTLSLFAALTLTLVAGILALFRLPHDPGPVAPALLLLVVFAGVFIAAGAWLTRRRGSTAESATARQGQAVQPQAALIPVAACTMPFVLLVLLVLKLPLFDPSPAFGAGMLFVTLLLGLATVARQTPLVPTAAVLMGVLEMVWHRHRFHPQDALTPLLWYLVCHAVFTAFPFLFRRLRGESSLPWVASALSSIIHFLLIHDLIRKTWPNPAMGLLPALFAIPALASLVAVKRAAPVIDGPARTRLAWLGGVSLLFITLIFPIQLDRHWLTVSWAFEGACLIWLLRRVPHPGLRWTGLALLVTAFIRLFISPTVFGTIPRVGPPVLNWHFHTYGLTALALFLAANWLPETSQRWRRLNFKGLLHALGGILLFLLLNIEIAHFFSPLEERFATFEFGGDFARDMTCTIAWGLFALATLGLGIRSRSKGARYAAIALLVLTLLKLFLHDLSAIHSIHRIAALIGVGAMAFLASFLYQRFYSRSNPP
jgi:uncharacterized membrane protein